ncbi:TE2IP protein, partial [Brachypteracias leptosomus]|nr:TE2IP protein [Brachypteracias leptosomus]
AARSRSLFLWDDGSPMRFYVRPGQAKLRLAPLVLAGGRPAGPRRRGAALGPAAARSRCSHIPAEPPPTEEPTPSTGLFEAANREFESTESGSDTSDISEELSTQNGGGKSPGEAASDLKTGPEDSTSPDTQLQREERPTSTCSSSSVVGEVVKTMQHFMEKFSLDLFTVTQAFLKNTGEVEATLYFLQTGQRLDGYPIWSREDDLELQKNDDHTRNKLIAKFGAENVAKRVAFRKS